MKVRNNRQAVTFRLNLMNEKDRKIYENLLNGEHGDISMSAQVRNILLEHYENEENEKHLKEASQELKDFYKKILIEIKKIIREEMQNHDMRVLAVLASNGNYSLINLADNQKKGKEMKILIKNQRDRDRNLAHIFLLPKGNA